jgi:hypothetical protein
MKATITYADGRVHTCYFPGGDWADTYDPPWEQVPWSSTCDVLIYKPILGVEHKLVKKNIKTGEIISYDEYRERQERGTLI